MEWWVTQLWYGSSAALILRPFALLYRFATVLRRHAYVRGWLRSFRVGCPVVIVGNLTVGGTGKTPLVAWFAQQLTQRGFKVGIVSRGYGRRESTPRVVESDADWRDVGDEPLLLRRATGCLTVVSADRVAGARMLVEQGATLVLADDGLQHLRLARDCEIVVIDGARGFGNGWLLPAGPLREPPSRLSSVDAVVVNGEAERAVPVKSTFEMKLAPSAIRAVKGDAMLPVAPTLRVHAVAGIGNPRRFFRDLRLRGIEVIEHPFPDHHAFTERDLEFDDGLPVLMTEKDAVKCRAFSNPLLWYVPVAAQFDEPQARLLLDRVLRKVNSQSKG